MIGMAGALDRRMREMPMKIGELARQAGVGVETVRYYQRRGLLSVPERQGRACRSYPPDMVRQIRRIRLLRELGFSLDMIRDLLLSEAEGCPDVRIAIQGRIGATLRDLDALRRRLDHLRAALAWFPCAVERRTCGLACLTGRADASMAACAA
jgi:DNA-binding transcriptional MerR regulator